MLEVWGSCGMGGDNLGQASPITSPQRSCGWLCRGAAQPDRTSCIPLGQHTWRVREAASQLFLGKRVQPDCSHHLSPLRISHITSPCCSPHRFQTFQASAVFQLWIGAFPTFSMGCVKGSCPKGAATSRVLQESGAGQGKGKALLGRSLGRDGCAGSAATTFLSLLLWKAEDPCKTPRILLLEASSASAQFGIGALERAALSCSFCCCFLVGLLVLF